jgi:hypothetical protein
VFDYRMIPIKVEAVCWRRDLEAWLMPDWLVIALKQKKGDGPVVLVGNRLHVKTSGGLVIAEEGDWIVRNRKRELSVYKPEEFDRTFQRIERERSPKIRGWKDDQHRQ